MRGRAGDEKEGVGRGVWKRVGEKIQSGDWGGRLILIQSDVISFKGKEW